MTSLLRSSPTEIPSNFLSSYKDSARVSEISFLLHPGGPIMNKRFTISFKYKHHIGKQLFKKKLHSGEVSFLTKN
jgi:hypothetical protein